MIGSVWASGWVLTSLRFRDVILTSSPDHCRARRLRARRHGVSSLRRAAGAVPRPARGIGVTGLAVVALAIVPSASGAATVTVRGDEIVYVAAPGERNDV